MYVCCSCQVVTSFTQCIRALCQKHSLKKAEYFMTFSGNKYTVFPLINAHCPSNIKTFRYSVY